MKQAIFFLLLIFIIENLAAQVEYKYKVEQVTEDIYALRPEGSGYRWVTANITVVINKEDVLVVDSGLLPEAGREAIKEIRELTDKPVKYLFNTHWHGDHWQGNEIFLQTFPDIKIIATKEGAEGIKQNGMLWVNKLYPKNFELMIDSYEDRLKKGVKADGTKLSDEERDQIKEGIELVKMDLTEVKKLKPIVPTLTFEKSMVLQCGDREIQFHYLGKGNTRGDGVIYLPQERILITGDLVVHPSPYESGTFSLEWLKTSQCLAEFNYLKLIPGHGEVQHDTSYLDFLNALFSEIIKQVNQAYQEGSYTLEEYQKLVNHESVKSALSKESRFAEHIKKLSPGFVPTCVDRVHRQAHDRRLVD